MPRMQHKCDQRGVWRGSRRGLRGVCEGSGGGLTRAGAPLRRGAFPTLSYFSEVCPHQRGAAAFDHARPRPANPEARPARGSAEHSAEAAGGRAADHAEPGNPARAPRSTSPPPHRPPRRAASRNSCALASWMARIASEASRWASSSAAVGPQGLLPPTRPAATCPSHSATNARSPALSRARPSTRGRVFG